MVSRAQYRRYRQILKLGGAGIHRRPEQIIVHKRIGKGAFGIAKHARKEAYYGINKH